MTLRLRKTSDCGCGGPQSAKLRSRDSEGASPLYVYRRILNASSLEDWAKSAGVGGVTSAEDMHVTCVYSKSPVDWFSLPQDYYSSEKVLVLQGGPRRLEMFGTPGDQSLVLRFKSSALELRHQELLDGGCSSTYRPYCPHVTLSRDTVSPEIMKLEAYSGPIELGPEIFAPMKD